MEPDPTRVCELVAALGDVDVVVVDEAGEALVVETRAEVPGCGAGAALTDPSTVDHVDGELRSVGVAAVGLAPLALCRGGVLATVVDRNR